MGVFGYMVCALCVLCSIVALPIQGQFTRTCARARARVCVCVCVCVGIAFYFRFYTSGIPIAAAPKT